MICLQIITSACSLFRNEFEQHELYQLALYYSPSKRAPSETFTLVNWRSFMRHILVYCAIGLLICLSAATLYGDIARPKPSSGDRKIVFHTSLSVVPDTNVSEARLRIAPATLNNIRAAMAGAQASETMGQRMPTAHHVRSSLVFSFFCRSRLLVFG